MIHLQSLRQQATEQVMFDLVNNLLLEDIGGLASRGSLEKESKLPVLALASEELLFRYDIDQGQAGSAILFRVRQTIVPHQYRLSRLPVVTLTYSGSDIHTRELLPVDLLRLLVANQSNLEALCFELNLAIEHTMLSLEATPHCLTEVERDQSLSMLERFAALTDRPFHPTARARVGWQIKDYQRYNAESGLVFGLSWLAVRRDYLRSGDGSEQVDPGALLLESNEYERVKQALSAKVERPHEYVLLPVHPWQMRHTLPKLYQDELREGICIPLLSSPEEAEESGNIGKYTATASLRSLAPLHVNDIHVKVPLSIYALGALRTLPPRYMDNGQKGQQLLQQLRERNDFLSKSLLYCQEDEWWSFRNPHVANEVDLYNNPKSGHLGCLIRRYPTHLMADGCRIVPMSAFTVLSSDSARNPVIERLLRERTEQKDEQQSLFQLWQELCDLFCLVALTCASYGVVPEMHGQNVLLLFRQGKCTQILLRDHDTVRIYPSWLKAHDLPDPGYNVKPNTRNTLILSTPADLLAYWQTLGVQVNLASIVRVLVTGYHLDELMCWQEIKASIQRAIATLERVSEIREHLTDILLHQERWPVKLLLTPLLLRTGPGDEGMPSSMASGPNPLLHL